MIDVTEECAELGLEAILVVTSEQVERLRQLRNATAWGYSAMNDQITPQVQRAWWSAMRGQVRAWLYSRDDQIVGFGLLRKTPDERWWTTVGVLDDYAGRGYGGAITADLARRHDSTVYATARLDNPAAQRLHRERDWEETGRDERLVHYRTRQHVHMKSSTEEWARYGWALT